MPENDSIVKCTIHPGVGLRYFGPAYQTRIKQSVAMWYKVGVIVEQPGPADHEATGLPERVWVETGLAEEFSEGDPTWRQVLLAEGVDRLLAARPHL